MYQMMMLRLTRNVSGKGACQWILPGFSSVMKTHYGNVPQECLVLLEEQKKVRIIAQYSQRSHGVNNAMQICPKICQNINLTHLIKVKTLVFGLLSYLLKEVYNVQ